MPRARANEHEEGVDGRGLICVLACGREGAWRSSQSHNVDMKGAYTIMDRYSKNVYTFSCTKHVRFFNQDKPFGA